MPLIYSGPESQGTKGSQKIFLQTENTVFPTANKNGILVISPQHVKILLRSDIQSLESIDPKRSAMAPNGIESKLNHSPRTT